MMAYYQLNEDNVADYIRTVDSMKSIFSSLDNLEVKEIGDGNLNYVYIITNRDLPTETVILKQAVPFLRCVGEESPLSKDRMNFEIMALRKEFELCPDLVPVIYHDDKEMALVIMQNLNRHKIMRGEMNKGKMFPKMPEDISTFLARTMFFSSDWYLTHSSDKWDAVSDIKKQNVKDFVNTELCTLTENYIFSYPFYPQETNSYSPDLKQEDIDMIQKDGALKVAAAEIKYKFMNNAEVLLHGDLHTGSLMVNEKETFVIDPEFAFYGPAGFDIGLLLGNMFLAYIAQEYRQKVLGNDPKVYRSWVLSAITDIWNKFAAKYDALWKEHQEETKYPYWEFEGGEEAFSQLRKNEIERIFHDAVGIAGSVMIRRTLGLAKVSDIADIEDTAVRADLDRKALKIGREFLLNYKSLTSVEQMVSIAKEISPL